LNRSKIGKKSLRKGKRGEYLIRKLLEQHNIEVVNQAEDKYKPDIRIQYKDLSLDGEVKYRSSVPKCIYDWINEKRADCLIMKRISSKDKGNDWLVVMRVDLFTKLLKGGK